MQYKIFSSVFSEGKNNALFLIGDPKQAIYSFRGADIFTYMKAAKEVDNRYGLKENWRSSESLIKGVNTIFSQSEYPFIYKEIPFIPSSYPFEKKDKKKFLINGKDESGIKIVFFVSEKKDNINKGDAKEMISRSFAYEISKLLTLAKEGKAFIGEKKLKPEDIAVLVRKNSEAAMISDTLFRMNIKNKLYNTGNIFETKEAIEMARLLTGIADFHDIRAVKTALSAEMFGTDASELYEISEDDKKWEKKTERFAEYCGIWKKNGFIRMFNYMAEKEKIYTTLISFRNGERKITNMRHLSEILHKTEVENKKNMTVLVKWLGDRIADQGAGFGEESLLRLESDENAVTIVTIHKSKGLEYPVVFCPFISDGSEFSGRNNAIKFHDKDDNLFIDIGSEDFLKNKKIAEKELLSENMRLFYVAVTRAKYLCYLAWGKITGSESSAPSYLFHYRDRKSEDDIVTELKECNSEKKSGELYNDLSGFEKNSDKSISVFKITEEDINDFYTIYQDEAMTPPELESKEFTGEIKQVFGISSFSSIIRENKRKKSEQTSKAIYIPEEKNSESYDIYRFPKGARSGTFIHDVLEHIDFTKKEHKSIIREKLDQYGYDMIWEQTISDMIDNLLSFSPDKDSDLSLSRIGNKEKIRELEFYFSVKPAIWRDTARLFKDKFGYDKNIASMNSSTLSGFMKGFIDMVFIYKKKFYIIDWKFNHLGDSMEDYNYDAMLSAMISHDYILQYHIYTLALDKFLAAKIENYDYDKHFGKVFYIFLRGINKDARTDFGIFADRPDKSAIADFGKIL